MSKLPVGKFVWFEHVSKHADKAKAFYGELFNWSVQDVPLPGFTYSMIATTGGKTVGGYSPPDDDKTPPHWLSHLLVDNAEQAVARVTKAGGKALGPAIKVGDMGIMAKVADPLGGVLCLWQPFRPDDTADDGAAPKDGELVWNELYTEDVDKSLAFYKAVGGYTVEPMDMGPMGTYHILKTGETSRGGVMKTPMPGVPQSWLPYVQVANADATIERAKKLGAEIKVPPSDIPNVGRFAIFVDPQGAALGIIQQ
jgi:predicted enzyme related to lactoylglutathione lyase